MTKYVLDSSALLALVNKETGSDIVEKHLHLSIMSAVNVSECAAVLSAIGIPDKDTHEILNELIPEIIPFDAIQAFETGFLRKFTKSLGLSLGDRACLALGKIRKYPVITADRIWESVKYPVKITVIR